MSRLWTWFGLVAACLLPVAAFGAPPVVLHSLEHDAVSAATLARDATGSGNLQIVGALSEWTDAATAPLVVVGASARRCTDLNARPLRGTQVEVKRQLLDMDYAAAFAAMYGAAKELPCGALDASREEIYDLFFVTGLAEFNKGNAEGAHVAFVRAATISPGHAWDPQHPPTAKAAYLEALQSVVARPPRTVASEVGVLAFDGEAVDAAAPPPLLSGGHLIQADESAVWAEVGDGPLLITTSTRLHDGLLAGDARYAPWLAALAAEQGWVDLLLVGPQGVVRFQGGRFVPLGEASSPSRAAPDAPGPAIALVAGGIGAAAFGFGLHAGAFAVGSAVREAHTEESRYAGLQRANRAGFAVGLAGATAAVVGIVWALVDLKTAAPVAVVPWALPAAGGVAVGLTGRLP